MTDVTDTLPQRALALARKHEEKLRFLVVGTCNTAISYALYALGLFLLGTARYNLALVSAWVIGVSVSYTNFKLFVFKTRGTNWVTEWLRSYVVYAGALVVNLLILNAFVRLLHMHPLVGQAASLLIVTIMSYLGHKYFTFGGRTVIESVDDSAAFEPEVPGDPGAGEAAGPPEESASES